MEGVLLKKIIVLLLISVVVTACGNSGDDSESSNGDSQHTIRLAHVVAEDQASHIAAETFKEKIESESDGEIEVEIYPNGSLYQSEREAIEAVQIGNIEMTITASAILSSFDEDFKVFDLPFLFDNHEAAYKGLDGEAGQELLDDLDKEGLKGLVFAENGFHNISNNEGPINSPEDLEGLKIRTMESEIHTDTFNAFGANASPLAFGELYTALQQGTYDAIAVPISIYYTGKFYEVQDYLTISNHFYVPTVALMNNDFYNDLSEDLQSIVMEASQEYREEQREISREQEEEFYEDLKENMEINELTEDELEVFRNAVDSVYEKHAPKIGEDLIEEMEKANN